MSVVRVDKVPYSVAGFGQTLTHDLAYGVPSALQFFPARQWQDVARQIDAHRYPRTKLAAVLEQTAQKLNAPQAVRDNIALLAQENTYVVATGQQAGLLGGPLYSLHKALTAIKLARQYEQEAQGRIKFVPIFWVAGDDHDIAEIDHADLIEKDGSLTRLRPEIMAGSEGRSACDTKLSREPGNMELLRNLQERDPELGALLLAYYLEHDFETAFAALMLRWLGPLGLVVVPSSAMRQFAGDLILRDLNEYDVVSRLIQEAAVALQKHRYEPGFAAHSRVAPHFFIAQEPCRIRAHIDPRDQDSFQERSPAFSARGVSPRTYSRQELIDLIAARPELFSTSAALRPVLQQQIFPVATAVLGPGEIAYWSQLRKVHDHFGVVWPVVRPRATLTLIDANAGKAMRKLGIAPGSPELFLDSDALAKSRLSGGRVGSHLDRRIAGILEELDALEAEVHAADGGLKPLFDKAKARIAHELSRVSEKTKASIEQREGAGMNRLRYLSSLVRPKNQPQERVLCAGQFMSQFPSLPQDLLDAIDLSAREHLVVTLS